MQDVFVELWSHPDRYDPAAGTLRTFLLVQARHRAVDVLRSELRRLARQERHHRLTPGQRPITGRGYQGRSGPRASSRRTARSARRTSSSGTR